MIITFFVQDWFRWGGRIAFLVLPAVSIHGLPRRFFKCRRKTKKITLECVIPFPGQADSWEKADQRRRYNILTAADKAVITSEQYNRGCFFTRNRYMVDKADVVVCAFNGKSGGTAYTVDYALKQNKIVIQIDPETSEVSMLSKRSFESV